MCFVLPGTRCGSWRGICGSVGTGCGYSLGSVGQSDQGIGLMFRDEQVAMLLIDAQRVPLLE